MKIHYFNKCVKLIIASGLMLSLLMTLSCNKETVEDINGEINKNNNISEKVSGELLSQVELRKEQIEKPTVSRLELMTNMGMNTDNLEIQQIFIHLNQAPDSSQIAEMESLGINLHLDSWIPPVGSHPTGFVIADMPVDKLETLAGKDYVVKLETAERISKPQNGDKPQIQ